MGYETLGVWQRAMDLAVDARLIADTFPRKELFGLASQVATSADSVPSNIAEGEGRRTTAEKLRFLGYSLGSLYELETRLRVAERFGYVISPKIFGLIAEVKNLLRSYMHFLESTRK